MTARLSTRVLDTHRGVVAQTTPQGPCEEMLGGRASLASTVKTLTLSVTLTECF